MDGMTPLKLVGGIDSDPTLPKVVWKKESRLEQCPTESCLNWMVWWEIYPENRPHTLLPRPRFKKCCDCAAREWEERG